MIALNRNSSFGFQGDRSEDSGDEGPPVEAAPDVRIQAPGDGERQEGGVRARHGPPVGQ